MARLAAAADPESLLIRLDDYAGSLAFDVGGNQGASARIFSRNFNRVVSFEPAAESFAVLSRMRGVEAVNVAVTDHDGTVNLGVQAAAIQSGQLVTYREDRPEWGDLIGHRQVPAITLATAAEKWGVPDFIKIDVEGHEVAVIKGGLDLIREHRPHLFIEVHWQDLGEQIVDLLGDVYDLEVIRHPHYSTHHKFWPHHYWLAT